VPTTWSVLFGLGSYFWALRGDPRNNRGKKREILKTPWTQPYSTKNKKQRDHLEERGGGGGANGIIGPNIAENTAKKTSPEAKECHRRSGNRLVARVQSVPRIKRKRRSTARKETSEPLEKKWVSFHKIVGNIASDKKEQAFSIGGQRPHRKMKNKGTHSVGRKTCGEKKEKTIPMAYWA